MQLEFWSFPDGSICKLGSCLVNLRLWCTVNIMDGRKMPLSSCLYEHVLVEAIKAIYMVLLFVVSGK